MPKFRKKPVVIDAFQLTWKSVLATTPKEDQLPDWIVDSKDVRIHLTDKIENSEYALIKTLEGEMLANHLDYIIKGVKGELYPCKPDIFEMTYEAVSA